MRLPFFRSKPATAATARAERARAAPAGDDSALLDAARTRARRRLAGALVLLAVGVVGFPIVFETEPRPLPVDTPILLPPPAAAGVRREPPAPAAPLVRPVQQAGADESAEPAAEAASARPAPPPAAATATTTAAPARVIDEPAVQPSPPNPTTAAASAGGAAAPAERAAPAVAAAPPIPPVSPPQAASAAAGRFVVQVGAYTDAATLRATRARVEKLGLKTYTQVVGNDAGSRTRIRIGPFATRDEADAAAARLKLSGLPANILAL